MNSVKMKRLLNKKKKLNKHESSLEENVDTEEESQYVTWFILHKFIFFFSSDFWRIFILFSIFLNYVITTFGYIFLKQLSKEMFYFILTMDCLYILNYFTAVLHFFWKNEQIHINKRPSRVQLIIDFFIGFPYSYIYEAIVPKSNESFMFLYLRAILIFRLFHVVLFFNEKRNIIGSNNPKNFIIEFLVYLTIYLHGIACVWYIMVYPNYLKFTSEGWITSNYTNTQDLYTICLYLAFTHITGRNFGGIILNDTSAKILTILMNGFGFILTTGIYIGTLSYLLGNIYKLRATLRTQLINITRYLEHNSLDDKYKKAIYKYYEIFWDKKDGVHESKNLTQLPLVLKNEICLDINIRPLLSSTIFQDKSEAFLRSVSSLMRQEFYQPEELIYFANVVKDKMILVAFGVIEVLYDEDNENSVIAFGPGTCLGESALILSLPSKCSVRAASYTELQVLYRKDFYTIADLYPQQYADIHVKISQRILEAEDHSKSQVEPKLTGLSSTLERHSAIKEMKNKLRGDVPLDTKEDKYLGLYRLQSDGSSPKKTSGIILSDNFPWILQPNSIFSLYWEWLIIFIATFISISYPYYIIFLKQYPHWFTTSTLYTDLILIFDVIIILCTAIEEKNNLIYTFTGILHKRLTQFGFYLDLLSSISIDMLYFIFSDNERFKYVLKLNRLLKAYRIAKKIHKTEHKIDAPILSVRIVKYIIYLLFSTYWLGALFYVITCFDHVCTEDGWYFTNVISVDNDMLISIYYSLFYLSRPTFIDISPKNILDMVMACFGILLGVLLIGFCIAELCATFILKWKNRRTFKKMLHSTEKFVKSRNIGKSIVIRVQNFLALQWNYYKHALPKGQYLFFNASNTIKAKVLMNEKIETIADLSLFQGKNLDFLSLVATTAEVLILPPNEILVYKGEPIEDLFIVLEGYLMRYTENDKVILGPKSVLDIVYLFTIENSVSTIKTVTHVKILSISHKEFWKVASMFPLVSKPFQAVEKSLDLANNIQKYSKNEHTIKSEEDIHIEGSFVNVILYCRRNDENYWKPFGKFKYLCWIRLTLLPFSILPSGIFLKVWTAMRLFFAFTVILLIPYRIILFPHQNVLNGIIFVTDIAAYIDLYVMTHVGFYGSKNQLIIHPLETATHYLKGKFMFDLMFCFPWEMISAYFNIEEHLSKKPDFTFSSGVMLLRMGQIYRLLQFFDYISKDIIRRKYQQVFIMQIMKYVSIIVIFLNFFATILIRSTCLYYDKEDNHTFIEADRRKSSGLYCEKNSWIDKSQFQNFTQLYQVFITSVYFCTSTLTGTGIGDITPQHTKELLLTVILILCGILFFGYVNAKDASYEANWNSLLSKYQKAAIALRKFMKQEKVRLDLQYQITANVEYRWKRCKETPSDVSVLQNLHSALHRDVSFAIYENILSKVPIFEGADKSFLRMISEIVTERYYHKLECIYRSDDVVSDIFILYDGKVQLNFRNDDYQTVMHPGGIFGNLSSSERSKMLVTVTAVCNVDVLCFAAKDFYDILRKYPSVQAKCFQSFTGGLAFLLPKPTPEFDAKESNLQPRNEINSILGCLLICIPWKLFHVSVSHHSSFLTFCDIFCFILAYINCLMVLYEFAFQHHTLPLLCLAAITDALFFMKSVLDMHKSYEDRYGDQITSNRNIIKRYFEEEKVIKWLQLLCNVPIFYLAFLSHSKTEAYLWYSSLRLITIFRLLNFFDYHKRKKKRLLTKTLLLKIVSMVKWGTIMVHVFTCGWYLCSCPWVTCFEESWRKKALPVNTVRRLHAISMTSSLLIYKEKLDIYISCLYFITGLFTSSSNGDVVPYSLLEQIYVMLVMVMANFITGIFIGSIINILKAESFAKDTYEYDVKELDIYLRNCHTSPFQLENMKNYTQQLWISENNFQLLLNSSPILDLLVDIYGHHLEKTNVFSDAEEAFIRQLAGHFKRTVFFPGNYVVKHGDSNKSMYFIHCGEVEILTIYPNLTETVHDVLRAGEMFGLSQGLFHGVPHHFSFRARCVVHTASLCLDDWEYLLDFFPASKESIYNRARNIYT